MFRVHAHKPHPPCTRDSTKHQNRHLIFATEHENMTARPPCGTTRPSPPDHRVIRKNLLPHAQRTSPCAQRDSLFKSPIQTVSFVCALLPMMHVCLRRTLTEKTVQIIGGRHKKCAVTTQHVSRKREVLQPGFNNGATHNPPKLTVEARNRRVFGQLELIPDQGSFTRAEHKASLRSSGGTQQEP